MVSNHTRGLAIDSIGNLWVGTNRGVSKFDGEKWITYNRSNDPQIIKIDNNWLMFYFGAY